jgi:hypothetical protein
MFQFVCLHYGSSPVLISDIFGIQFFEFPDLPDYPEIESVNFPQIPRINFLLKSISENLLLYQSCSDRNHPFSKYFIDNLAKPDVNGRCSGKDAKYSSGQEEHRVSRKLRRNEQDERDNQGEKC